MSADAPPTAFGRFRVVRPLRPGGMGALYLAEDSLLKRQVAVKVPLIDKQADPQVIERFLREAQAAARIDHPNVCPVFEVGEQGQGYYLVMPFLEGTPLDRLVGSGRRWEVGRALDLMVKLAGGVQAIHDKGLIHRDLKPGNVMMRGDEPVILDLGLARSIAGEGQRLTRQGQVLGTPAYMAPEQLTGDPERLGPATDVYALGVILYELLTGELPFVGPLEAVCAQILQGSPRPPSALREGLGGWADDLCRKAMAKEPTLRHVSARELAQALQACGQALGERSVRTSRAIVRETASPSLPPLPPNSTDTFSPLAPTPAPADAPASKRGKAGPGWAGHGRMWLALAGVPVVVGILALLGWLVASLVDADPASTRPHAGRMGGERVPGAGLGVEPPPDPVREITNSIGMKFVRIPAGQFTMGSPEGEKDRGADEVEHEVEISEAFYLGIHEVTQAQYEQVMGNNPAHFNQDNGGGSEHPVERVTWHDAVAFCKKFSEKENEKSTGRWYRLPTEAEWEYSCREGGSSQTPFHFGMILTSDLANFNGNFPYGAAAKGRYLERTTKVGSYKPNALGLYDLHGNVWEWCADWYEPDYYSKSPRRTPPGPNSGKARVVRGACWNDHGHLCRAANRNWDDPGIRDNLSGFRVVCVPPRAP